MNAKLQDLGELLMQPEPRTSLKLYEIAASLEAVEEALLESGGEITPEMEVTLEQLEGSLEEKAERICRVIRNHELSAEAFDAEIGRLKGHKAAHENTADRLKAYLQAVMIRLDRPKIDARTFKVAIQKNSRPSIRWLLDVAQIPERFKRVTVELDGNRAYDAVRAGEQLPDGFEVVAGSHLRIR